MQGLTVQIEDEKNSPYKRTTRVDQWIKKTSKNKLELIV